jgi:adenine-specific DNA methylase
MARLAKAVRTGATQIEFDYGCDDPASAPFPERAAAYPELRYMGSKHRLLPWIHSTLRMLDFDTAADPFVGSGCVAYLLKCMGKSVIASDFLNFPVVLARATIGNSVRIMERTRVKKIEKPYTPFSYRRTAVEAFDRMFRLYRDSIIVLSYSSNGYPDREQLENILGRYKQTVTAYERPHRYHFGTHGNVERAVVNEYLIVGR